MVGIRALICSETVECNRQKYGRNNSSNYLWLGNRGSHMRDDFRHDALKYRNQKWRLYVYRRGAAKNATILGMPLSQFWTSFGDSIFSYDRRPFIRAGHYILQKVSISLGPVAEGWYRAVPRDTTMNNVLRDRADEVIIFASNELKTKQIRYDYEELLNLVHHSSGWNTTVRNTFPCAGSSASSKIDVAHHLFD